MKLIAGQVAVVTGAASGIGLALCRALAARGLHVCLLDMEEAALDAATGALCQDGACAERYLCDVTDSASMESVAADILRRHGRVDLLVNNAGVGGLLGPIWNSPPQDWQWVFGVNLFGAVNGLRAFVPAMLARGSGHVVNVASLAGLTAPPFLATYAASKHALVGLTESLAAELAISGGTVTASVVCPGNVESRIRDADRNRPAALQARSNASLDLLARLDAVFTGVMSQGLMPADTAADRILVGIERDDLHILTHPDQLDGARERVVKLNEAMAAA